MLLGLAKNILVLDFWAFFTHPAQVHVLRLDADDGVRCMFAESAELNRTDLIGPAAAPAPAAVWKNSGLALPGILMTRSAAR